MVDLEHVVEITIANTIWNHKPQTYKSMLHSKTKVIGVSQQTYVKQNKSSTLLCSSHFNVYAYIEQRT